MATFPELEPNTRSYDFGLFALTEEQSMSAGIVRFRHSTTPQNYRLTLGYNAITDAQADLIRSHYQGQNGGYRSFQLPSIVWKGHTFSGNVVPYTAQWRYMDTPEEEHLQIGRINMTIALGSDGYVDTDPDAVYAAITGGGAGTTNLGFNVNVTASIAAGTATGA